MEAELQTITHFVGFLRSHQRFAWLIRFSFAFTKMPRTIRLGYFCVVRSFGNAFPNSTATIRVGLRSDPKWVAVDDVSHEYVGRYVRLSFLSPRVKCLFVFLAFSGVNRTAIDDVIWRFIGSSIHLYLNADQLPIVVSSNSAVTMNR